MPGLVQPSVDSAVSAVSARSMGGGGLVGRGGGDSSDSSSFCSLMRVLSPTGTERREFSCCYIT